MGLTVPNGFSITGIVKFHEVSLSEVEAEREGECSQEGLGTSGSLLEHYIQSVRDTLGVETGKEDG